MIRWWLDLMEMQRLKGITKISSCRCCLNLVCCFSLHACLLVCLLPHFTRKFHSNLEFPWHGSVSVSSLNTCPLASGSLDLIVCHVSFCSDMFMSWSQSSLCVSLHESYFWFSIVAVLMYSSGCFCCTLAGLFRVCFVLYNLHSCQMDEAYSTPTMGFLFIYLFI